MNNTSIELEKKMLHKFHEISNKLYQYPIKVGMKIHLPFKSELNWIVKGSFPISFL